MSTTEYHYTTYIKSTPEKVWAAITTPEFARQYWGNANFSDWKVGSRWEHRQPQGNVLVSGIIRESVAPRRLVMTWAAPAEHDDPSKHSRVSIEIEPIKDMVRLHITHDQLVAGSDLSKRISFGWPRVLSSLKTLLETGVALDTWAGNEHGCSAPAQAGATAKH